MPQKAAGITDLVGSRMSPVTHFALLAQRYMFDSGASARQIAAVAVKNSANAALNPNAQRPKARTLDEILAPPAISGIFTRLQCCPIGQGAAAAIVASDDAIHRLGIDEQRTVTVAASAARSENLYGATNFDAALTRETTEQALTEANMTPDDLDVVELHDAFTVEELLYAEAIGLCKDGHAAAALAAGEFDRGGRVAINTSGGLLSMGHPIGPTGVGQIAELTSQLRGEAGPRQHPGARAGLAHMVGLGAVCVVHILTKR
jgi:acetyl-CoA acetyltransferase